MKKIEDSTSSIYTTLQETMNSQIDENSRVSNTIPDDLISRESEKNKEISRIKYDKIFFG